jgi:hypothetical protein
LTHCRWNSTLETVAAGVPVLAFPQWGNQCTDAKFLIDELRMGVHLRACGRGCGCSNDRPEADAMLANAKSWSTAARAAVTPGGSSPRRIGTFRRSSTRSLVKHVDGKLKQLRFSFFTLLA